MTTLEMLLEQWKRDNALLNVVIIRSKRMKELLGRIISFDTANKNLIIYLDDKKQTELLNLGEIIDIKKT